MSFRFFPISPYLLSARFGLFDDAAAVVTIRAACPDIYIIADFVEKNNSFYHVFMRKMNQFWRKGRLLGTMREKYTAFLFRRMQNLGNHTDFRLILDNSGIL